MLAAERPGGNRRLMQYPRQVHVDISARCNLRCRYCCFYDREGQVCYTDLPTAEWLAFFAELGRCGVMGVVLSGGEPLLRPDLWSLLEGIVKNHMRFSLLSNASLVTDELAQRLADCGRCTFVQVSIDGSCAAVHDLCRGEGSFAATLRGLRCLQRHRVPVTVRLTVHRYNVADLENAARLLLDDLGLPSFSTNAAGYLGRCRQDSTSLLLGIEERQEAMRILLDLAERYPGRITAQAGPLADAWRWRRMERARREGAPVWPEGGRLSGCGCAFNKLAVLCDGRYVACALLPQLVLGRINRDTLASAWRHPKLELLRARRDVSLDSFPTCRRCPYRPYCTGNCPALGPHPERNINAPAVDACLRHFLDEGGHIP